MTKRNLKVVKSTKDQDIEKKEKNKALDAAINQITENFGKGSVMKLGQQTAMDIESISTGSLSLDLALGIGGLPKGRVIEIYGPEGSGKTTLALQVVAEAQKSGGICGFIDAESVVIGADLNLDQNNFIQDDKISYHSLDIASKHSVRLFLDELYKRRNSIDVLINNAGVSTFEPFEDRTEESFDWVSDVNLKGTFLCIKEYFRNIFFIFFYKLP